MVGGTTKQSISGFEIASLALARTRFNNMSWVAQRGNPGLRDCFVVPPRKDNRPILSHLSPCNSPLSNLHCPFSTLNSPFSTLHSQFSSIFTSPNQL